MNLRNVHPVDAIVSAKRQHHVVRNTASRTSSLLPIQRRQEEQCEYFKINPDLMPGVKK